LKRPPKKSKSKRPPEFANPREPAGNRVFVKPPTSNRQWLFRLVAMIVIPLVLLGGIEVALRLAGYGFSPSLFNEIQIGNGEFFVNNDAFGLRFFPPQLTRFTAPFCMAARKPADTYRIFILGESAAMGDPEPAYGASRYLEALLSERYPKTHFEIINLGMTAIDSHVILPIACECARHEGDLWIIYMGNNEMVGPFGAATVFGAKAPPLAMIRLNLAIQKTRLGQLLMNLGRKLKGGNANAPSWGGMEMFLGNQLPADDPRKEVVYQNFSRNLHDIVKVGLDSGAKILLNTVAVNLKDCAPFASLVNSNLPPTDRAQFDQFFKEGVQAEDQGHFADAAQKFELAATLDPKVAELQFRWGKSLLQLTNYAAAREHLQLACNDDALPFRADSRINAIIRNEHKKIGGDSLILFDAAAALAAETPENICGQETFYEHVHFNFDGAYRLGHVWAEQVAELLPAETTRDDATNGWATQETCERRLGLTDWNRSLIIQHMIERLRGPPLSSQLDSTDRLKTLEDRVNELQSRMNAAAAARVREDFQDTLEQSPDDYYLRGNFALFLQSVGDLPGAIAQWRCIHDLIPQDCVTDFQLGRLLEMQHQWVEAESLLREAVTIRPSLTQGWIELGNVLASQGKFEPALASYSRARQQLPRDPQTIFRIGMVLAKLNRHTEAIENYRAAIKLAPANWETHFELGGELDSANRLDEAGNEFGEAARLNPNNPLTHFNYGVLLAKQGLLDEARREFEETLRLEPSYTQAQEDLAQIQAMKNRMP
jgi:tetratricopeptide (TPR) repeat protein